MDIVEQHAALTAFAKMETPFRLSMQAVASS